MEALCAICGDRPLDLPEGDTCSDCKWLVELPDSPGPRIRALRAIVRDGKFAKIDGCVVDMTTASLLVKVYDALSAENKARFGRVDLGRLVDIAWKAAS